MNKREFIKRVIAGGRSDRIPKSLFGSGRWAYYQTGLKIESLDKDSRSFAESLARLYNNLDTDIIFAGSGLNTFPAEAIGGELSFKRGQTPLLAAPLIQTTEDARFLRNLDITHSPHSLALVEMIDHLRKLLPDRYLAATSWGPFTWAMILCDWNLLQDKTTSDKEFVSEVCGLGAQLSVAFFDRLVEQDVIDAIAISDGAATLIPLDLYQDVVLPAERALLERYRDRGIARFLHQCGKIEPQVALYPESAADCITLDAGVDLGQVYKLYQGRAVLAGNIDVIKTVFGGKPSEICQAVTECTSAIPDPFRNFILMPSCDLPPDTPLENVVAFLACADEAVKA
ncbi:MAG TPA: uroporphyrinogen decarboxylase family protein [Nitrospirota bacterium]|nr:uroporphyrinogen decarboxylase family protein [Nitrospirota bacterium]